MTRYVVVTKEGERFTLDAAEVIVDWPSVRLLDAAGGVIAAWFGDVVQSVYPYGAVGDAVEPEIPLED